MKDFAIETNPKPKFALLIGILSTLNFLSKEHHDMLNVLNVASLVVTNFSVIVYTMFAPKYI